MVYFYALVLMLSAGLFGTFCRSVMLGLGFVPNLVSGVSLLLATGAVYLVAQCSFMAVLRLLWPSKVRSVYFSEMFSNGATLILVPYILHVSIPWPQELLLRIEPLLYLSAFGAVHLFLKLSTFYASLQGTPSGRRGALGYAATAVACMIAAILSQGRWTDSLDAARPQVLDSVENVVAGSVHAEAYSMLEGASLSREIDTRPGQTITTRWTNTSEGSIERVHAIFVMKGNSETVYQSSTLLRAGAWSEIRVPHEFLPDDLRSVELRWAREKEPNWQRMLGLRPIVYNLPDTPGGAPSPPRSVLMSGPFNHGERPMVREPNIVLLMVDGLAANHLSMMGYSREVTPSLDKLGYGGLSFPNMYSPSAEVSEAARALLGDSTQMNSLVLSLAEAGYSTVGFTEGRAEVRPDLRYGSGFESGFELFDASYDAKTGSGATVKKAQAWIDAHLSVKFFMLLRLRSLEDLDALRKINGSYPAEGRTTQVDSFDNGLQRLDSQIGSLLKYIRDHDTRKNTVIILISPYGHAFSIRSDGRKLSEPELRTPLIINGPGIRKTKLSKRVDMNDVVATISSLTGVRLAGSEGGRSVL